MCFGGKPKMSKPKPMQAVRQAAAPIGESTPKVAGGADVADGERAKKRRTSGQNLSLFQIQLTPGAVTSDEEPGANTGEA